jgi:hypothetical protein
MPKEMVMSENSPDSRGLQSPRLGRTTDCTLSIRRTPYLLPGTHSEDVECLGAPGIVRVCYDKLVLALLGRGHGCQTGGKRDGQRYIDNKDVFVGPVHLCLVARSFYPAYIRILGMTMVVSYHCSLFKCMHIYIWKTQRGLQRMALAKFIPVGYSYTI